MLGKSVLLERPQVAFDAFEPFLEVVLHIENRPVVVVRGNLFGEQIQHLGDLERPQLQLETVFEEALENIQRLAFLFRGGVEGRAHLESGGVRSGLAAQGRQPEVRYLHPVRGVQQQVGGLDVAMHQAGVVQPGQAGKRLQHEPRRPGQGLGTAFCLHPPAFSDRLAQVAAEVFQKVEGGLPVAPHAALLSADDADSLDASLFPAILKTARMGYDGKGQRSVNNIAETKAAFAELGNRVCILEKKLSLAKEVSVIVVRSLTGETVTFPLFENVHRNGILATTVFPARVTDEVSQKVRDYAARIAETLQYKGVLCIEFFVLTDGSVSANEMAPRPHNSGHVTIEAAVTSQFEQQVRAMTGLPLGDTSALCHGVMLNLLGDLWFDENDNHREPNWAELLKIEGVKLHLYGKAEARRARKMGHVTILGATEKEALARAKRAAAVLGLPEPL